MAEQLSISNRESADIASNPLKAAAALSLAAAMIHASVIAGHFREYWLFGLFFTLSAILQLVWAGLVWSGREERWLLWVGALGNLAVALLWLYTRTVGLPIGPEAGETEVAGIHDVLATASELGLAALLGLRFAGRAPGQWVLWAAWILAAVSGVAAFLGPH